MKYLISLIAGMAAGAVVFLALLYYNPMTSQNKLSPLSVSDNEVITLNYSAVATDALVFTNDGQSTVAPYPSKVLQLWEPTVRLTDTMVTVLRDSRNQPVAIGIKFSSRSESTRILNGKAIIDSAWYVYLPEHGSLFIEQTENYFPLIREVAFPAWRSSASSWRGNWLGNLTAGPGALGTAAVTGGSGRVKGLKMEGVESMSVRAFSAETGLVSSEGRLLIEMPENPGGME